MVKRGETVETNIIKVRRETGETGMRQVGTCLTYSF